mmetsp:Transcript_14334/g.26061  ORF Transcript_14334/g.26061 Transcript_14334/m.26061 type:complete len:105 (+) Transcript_14334:53-367(+)
MGQILSCHIKFGVLADCAYAYFHHWTTIWPSTREFKIVILVSILVSIWAGSTAKDSDYFDYCDCKRYFHYCPTDDARRTRSPPSRQPIAAPSSSHPSIAIMHLP